ncbi:MAG: methylated-DNA--[protein]-cysteine S-methyltransferase [Geminicoccaceae bacterium]
MRRPASRWCRLPSPVGELLLTAGDGALTGLYMAAEPHAAVPLAGPATPDEPVLAETKRQLAAYFAGTLTAFTLPLALHGTAFQRRVWEQLLALPHGTTTTYAAIAGRLGQPTALRAVGAANGRNPVSIVVPCHRVVGSDGTLTGYGGGLPAKRWLLDHEAAVRARRTGPA